MKINYRNFEASIKQFKSVLVYGNDYGVVSQTVDNIVSKLITGEQTIFNFTSLQYNSIIKNPESLYNELNSPTLTKEKKVVLVNEVEKILPAWLKDLLLDINNDTFVIFKASELLPNVAIRKLFETEKKLAVIACYHDEYAITKSMVESKLKQHKINIDKDALDYLVANGNFNRLVLLSELDKLILFAQNRGKISLEVTKQLISLSGNSSIDDFCFDIALGNSVDFDLRLRQLLDTKTNIIAIIRSIARCFQQLLKAQSLIKNGMTLEQAMQKISPPVFFKYVPKFTICLKHYSFNQLQDVITALTDLELLCKSKNTDHKVLFEYMVLNKIMPKNDC